MTIALRLLAWLKALPAWIWPIAALVVFSGVQTWRASHWKDQAQLCEAGRKQDRDSYVQAQKDAATKALAEKARIEAEHAAQAERAQHDYEEQVDEARDATARYIVDHRVRAESSGGSSSGSTSTASDRGAGVSPGVSSDTFVAVSESDVQACSQAVSYALAARTWALGIAEVK